jgi:hypothetical protein
MSLYGRKENHDVSVISSFLEHNLGGQIHQEHMCGGGSMLGTIVFVDFEHTVATVLYFQFRHGIFFQNT